MYDTPQDLLDALRSTPFILNALLNDFASRPVRTGPPDRLEWSPVEIICHLRDAEESALERMRLMRDQEHPFLAAYDQEEWVMTRNYAAAGLQSALQAFLERRSLHISELEALPAADWQRPGRHEEQGEVTILSHTIHIVAHDSIHIAQLARLRLL
jgi:hypothetical protein